MPSKKTTTVALKFEKTAFYADQQGQVWCCTNGRTRKTADGNEVVDMRATENGKPTGDPGEEYVDTFVRMLTKTELAEHVEVEQREAEALVVADGSAVAGARGSKAQSQGAKKALAKPSNTKSATRAEREAKLSALDAAAKVLAESNQPMTAKAMIEAMPAKRYWTSPGGQTPQSTLYSALLREIQKKGTEARFQKVDRGQFALTSAVKK